MRQEKNILKKLMKESLDPNEKMELNELSSVKMMMQDQWDIAGDTVLFDVEKSTGKRIWKNITSQIWSDKHRKIVVFYKIYSLAATVLLLLGIVSMAYFSDKKGDIVSMYVVTSGIQNIESVLLPDGTNVQIGPGSSLTYPAQFTGKQRNVILNGQAFFDVAKNTEKPFIVHTKHMDVQALGTAFELFAFDVDSKTEAILLSGRIKVSLQNKKSDEEVDYILRPNEKLLLDKLSKKVAIHTVDANKYTSWRETGVLNFEKSKLSMIIPRLEQWYGRKIICQKDIAERFCFTFKVRDESLERILFMISKSSSLKYTKTENGDYILSLE